MVKKTLDVLWATSVQYDGEIDIVETFIHQI